MVRSVFPHIKREKEQASLMATDLEKIIISRCMRLYILTIHISVAVHLPEESWVANKDKNIFNQFEERKKKLQNSHL